MMANSIEKQEIVDITLYETNNKKQPYILTIYYNKKSTFDKGVQVWDLIKGVMNSNDLKLEEILILYYFDNINRENEIHRWKFDVFAGKYIGNTIDILPVGTFSNEIKEVHLCTLEKLKITDQRK